MIRLEVSQRRLAPRDGPNPENTWEWERMTLFAQEWADGAGPNLQALIAMVNDLSTGEQCQCGHTGKHHEGTGRCEVYSCHCPRLQLASKAKLESVQVEAQTLRKELATVTTDRDTARGMTVELDNRIRTAERKADRAVARLAKLKAEYDI